MNKRQHMALEPRVNRQEVQIVDDHSYRYQVSPRGTSMVLLVLFCLGGLCIIVAAVVLFLTHQFLLVAISFLVFGSFVLMIVSKVAEKTHGSWHAIQERNRQHKQNKRLDDEDVKAAQLENMRKAAEIQRMMAYITIPEGESGLASPLLSAYTQVFNHGRNRVLLGNDNNSEDNQQPQWKKPAKYDVDTVLDKYEYGSVFLGATADNHFRKQPIEKAFHMLICGSTSNGKTNLLRNLLMTMVDYAECYFVHPMFANVGLVKDHRKIEVWEPILKRLKNDPTELKGQPKKIESLFSGFTNLLDIRSQEKGIAEKESKWKPVYLFVDEGPRIVNEISNAVKTFGRIVREGRQLEIYLVLTAQSAQVQSLGIPTSDLTNFRTMFYLGGDDISRRYMLGSEKKKGKDLGSDESIEDVLNGGAMLVRAEGMSSSELLQTPLMTNTGIAAYFDEEFNENEYQAWLSAWEKKFGPKQRGRIGTVTVEEIDQDTQGFQETPDVYQSTVHGTFSFSRNSEYTSPGADTDEFEFPETNDQKRQSYVVQPKPIPITDYEIRTVKAAHHLLRNQNKSITVNALINAARTLVSKEEESEWHNSKSELVKTICEQEKLPLQRGIGGRIPTSKA